MEKTTSVNSELTSNRDTGVGSNPASKPFRSNVEFVEKPRSFSTMGILILTLCWLRHLAHEANTVSDAVFYMVAGILAVCVIYSVLSTADSPCIRPHPAFWRAWHGIGLWYALVVFGLFVAPADFGREFVFLVFPHTKQAIAEAGGESMDMTHLKCELTWPAFYNQITSFYFPCHAIGWFAKMIVFRDWILCIRYSFIFEMLELSMQWLIPEFKECWWDSLGADFLLANMLGMFIGALTLRHLTTRQYNWSAWSSARGIRAKGNIKYT